MRQQGNPFGYRQQRLRTASHSGDITMTAFTVRKNLIISETMNDRVSTVYDRQNSENNTKETNRKLPITPSESGCTPAEPPVEN